MKDKRYTSTQINRALGLFIALLSLVFFVSAYTKTTWGIAFLFEYLFGFVSYWFFLPLVFVTGMLLFLKGDKVKEALKWRIVLGIFVLLLGISLIFAYSSAAYYRDNSLDLYDFYGTETSGLKGEFASGKGVIDLHEGGGILLTLLATLLNFAGDALTITVAIIVILLGIFTTFYPHIMRFIHFLQANVSAHKAKKESEESIKRAEEEKRIALENYVKQNAPIEEVDKSEIPPVALSYEVEPETAKEDIPSRTSLYHSNSVSEISPVPQEMQPVEPTLGAQIAPEPLEYTMKEAVFKPEPLFAEEPAKKEEPVSKSAEPVTPPVPQKKLEEKKEETPDFGEIALPNANEHPSVKEQKDEVAAEEPTYKQEEKTIFDYQAEQVALEQSDETPKEEIFENEVDDEEAFEEEQYSEPEAIGQEPVQLVQPEPKEEEVLLKREETNPGAKYGAIPAKERPPYEFPPVDLLKDYPVDPDVENQNKLLCQQRMDIINQTLDNFNSGAHAISYTIGPSVTRYDIQVDPGTTVSSVNKYVTDISARLGGLNARYEEIILGKTTSGLEIPNEKSTTVSFKDVLNHLPQGPSKSMYIPFGVDISGNYISADLTAFPHMLVGGTSGSGKSVFAHGIIASLIMRNRPEDLKLVLVDPKRVEMVKYENIPHLLCPIIKEPSQAKVCLDKLIDVMEQRLVLFEFAGVRNIRDYNEKYCPKAGSEPIPFIVVFIDEYADLSDTCKNIGESVVRIAQKARAVGIHLIVATQRPSVNVITGVIKANLDTRVSLRVKTAQDSMTILTKSGAERLNGYGDMLVDCPKVSHGTFVRCQGCFIQDEELEAVTDFIKAQQTVRYDPNFTDLSDHSNDDKIAEENEKIERAAQREKEKGDLYETIKSDVMAQDYTSISKIQRNYNVGFPRAGKIFNRLMAEGIVAPPDSQSSAKGARVLIHDPSMLSNGNEDFSGDNDK